MRWTASLVTGSLLSLALTLAPLPARAAGGLTPEQASATRSEVRSGLSDDPALASAELQRAAEANGDPALFLAAADQLRFAAEEDRDLESAERALPLAMTANDIALYLANKDNFARTRWRPVTQEGAAELAGEANRTIASIEELIATIEAERAAAEAEAARTRRTSPIDDDKPRKPGTGLIIGGSASLVLGLAGVAMVGAGAAKGNARQREAEALDLPAELDQLAALDRQGAQANTLTYAGAGLAAVGVITGVTLIVLGVRKRRQAGETSSEHARVQVGGYFSPQGGGLQLQGRF